jgi:transketolase
LIDIRPADANEVTAAWRVAVLTKNKPVLMVLSRQNLPTFNRDEFNSASSLSKGAYILKDYGSGNPQLILLATGSEVALIVETAQKLANEGVNVRVVSMPSWSLFEAQDQSYRDSVLPPEIKNRVAVEAGSSLGWHKWVGQGKIIGIDRFGESGPYEEVYEELGLTVDTIYKTAKELID